VTGKCIADFICVFIMLIAIGALLYAFIFIGGISINTSVESHTVNYVDLNSVNDLSNYILVLDTGETVLWRIGNYKESGIVDNTKCRLKLKQNLFWEYRLVDEIMVSGEDIF